jgi:hypothetical protein
LIFSFDLLYGFFRKSLFFRLTVSGFYIGPQAGRLLLFVFSNNQRKMDSPTFLATSSFFDGPDAIRFPMSSFRTDA